MRTERRAGDRRRAPRFGTRLWVGIPEAEGEPELERCDISASGLLLRTPRDAGAVGAVRMLRLVTADLGAGINIMALVVRVIATDDPAKGQAVFTSICAKCHSLDPAESGKRGPHLSGLFERRYGSVEGFPYRMIWPDADPLWTKQDLNSYLEIHRIPDADERADIIECLFEVTRN